MARPNVTIRFANGALGSVAASADGVVGMVVAGAAVAGKLELGKAYVLYSPDNLDALVAGRVAKSPVQRHIGRVRDGALALGAADLTIDGSVAVEAADLDTPNNKGYIVPCTHVGRSGYYLCDDHLATAAGDDYHSLARRRVVDKAYRIAYDTLLDYLKDEVACNADGTLVAAVAKAWEADVVAAIAGQMTAAGELGNDPADPKDKGVRCTVDRRQNVVSTGTVRLDIAVKPYGYAKYIEATLGFTAVQS